MGEKHPLVFGAYASGRPVLGNQREGAESAPVDPLPELEAIEATLAQLAALAADTISAATGVCVTLLPGAGAPMSVGATAPFIAEVDRIQFRLHEGPSLDAARMSRTVLTGSLHQDSRWPRLKSRLVASEVSSALSQPVVATERVMGVVSVYASADDAFDDHAAHEARVFAGPAAIALRAALRAVTSSQDDAVAKAIGIMMCRFGCTEDRAMARLVKMSEHEHEHPAAIARGIIDEALQTVRTQYLGVRQPSRPYGANAPSVDPAAPGRTSVHISAPDPDGLVAPRTDAVSQPEPAK